MNQLNQFNQSRQIHQSNVFSQFNQLSQSRQISQVTQRNQSNQLNKVDNSSGEVQEAMRRFVPHSISSCVDSGQSPKEAEECRRVTIMFIRVLDMECEPFNYAKAQTPLLIQRVSEWLVRRAAMGSMCLVLVACTAALVFLPLVLPCASCPRDCRTQTDVEIP